MRLVATRGRPVLPDVVIKAIRVHRWNHDKADSAQETVRVGILGCVLRTEELSKRQQQLPSETRHVGERLSIRNVHVQSPTNSLVVQQSQDIYLPARRLVPVDVANIFEAWPMQFIADLSSIQLQSHQLLTPGALAPASRREVQSNSGLLFASGDSYVIVLAKPPHPSDIFLMCSICRRWHASPERPLGTESRLSPARRLSGILTGTQQCRFRHRISSVPV